MEKTGGIGKRGKRQIRLGGALVAVSALLLVVVGVAAWLYFSFSANVGAANARIDADIARALQTPPPATLVTAPQTDPGATGPAAPGDDELDAVMNMLVLGTDARPGAVEAPGSSDVIMLLHIDTRLEFLSILSIPRDLWVHIPGHWDDRINSAYYRGGPALTIDTLKATLGIDVTTYLGLGFESFPDLIDRLGGVYVDVDRRYTDTPYWRFDLSPGYQLLDGATALLYSRYRFDENADFGRMARQQRLLAGLRDQAKGWDKKLKLPGMVNAIMETATTNVTADEMLKLAYWLVKLDGMRMKQIIVKGPGKMIDGKAVVVVDNETLAQYVTDFLTPPPDDPTVTAAGARGADGAQMAAAQPPTEGPLLLAAVGDGALRSALAATVTTQIPPPTTAAATLPAILDPDAWRTAQTTVAFPLRAPAYLPEGFAYSGTTPESGGTYGIRADGGTKPAIRIGYRYRDTDEYLGISATTWLDAPLAGDGMVVETEGVRYTVVGTFGKPDHVWWISGDVLYWVSNTLMYSLGERELLKIAESTRAVSGS